MGRVITESMVKKQHKNEKCNWDDSRVSKVKYRTKYGCQKIICA